MIKYSFFILLFWIILTSEGSINKVPKLIWKAKAFSRSSFCLYDDGLFYQTEAAGCTHQWFAWGKWTKNNDTLCCDYSNQNIFNYQITNSKGTSNKYQIVRLLDIYEQPIRFQFINHGISYSNTFNIGMFKIEKKNQVSYTAPYFDATEF